MTKKRKMYWYHEGYRITVIRGEYDEENGDQAYGYEVLSEEELPEAHRLPLSLLKAAWNDNHNGEVHIDGVGSLYAWDRGPLSGGPTVYIASAYWGDVDAPSEEDETAVLDRHTQRG